MPYKNQTTITITRDTKQFIENNINNTPIINRVSSWDGLLLELTKYYLEHGSSKH